MTTLISGTITSHGEENVLVLHGTAWFFFLITALLVTKGEFGAAAIMGLCTGALFGFAVSKDGD